MAVGAPAPDLAAAARGGPRIPRWTSFRGEVCLEKNDLGPVDRSVGRARPVGGPRLKGRVREVPRFVLQGRANREVAVRSEIVPVVRNRAAQFAARI